MCTAMANAQSYIWHLQKQEAGKGTVTVIESSEITTLVNGNTAQPAASASKEKKQAVAEKKEEKPTATATKPHATKPAENKSNSGEEETTTTVDTSRKVRLGGSKVTGYRVQVFSGGNSRVDRTKAESIGNALKSQMPEYPVYTHFYSPRWVCRIGNFKTYEEASECLRRAKALGYAQSCIVKGQITVYD